MQKKEQQTKSRFQDAITKISKISTIIFAILRAIGTLFILLIFLAFLSLLFPSYQDIKSGNIEIIPLTGVITTTGDSGLLSEKTTQSDKITKELKNAEKNEQIRAVIIEINSPGGAPVASYEIAEAIKKMKKPTVAVIRETGASGAYWAATAANKIYANPLSVTGSIGVLASHLEFAGTMKKYNMTYRRLVAGKYKDAGSPYKEMSTDEQTLYQNLINKLHEEFIKAVSQNRKLSIEQVRSLADGFVFLGTEAKEKGLIDELGGREEAIKYLEQKLNITAQPYEYKELGGLTEMLSGLATQQSFTLGKGIGAALFTAEKTTITT